MIVDFINFWLNLISPHLLVIKIVSFLVSCLFLALIIYFISETEVFSEPIEHFFDVLGKIDMSKRRTLKAWKQIQKRLKSGKTNDMKLAVLEADKILDQVLKMAGYDGENLDERLEKMDAGQLSNIEEIRQAHKLKKRIVSEPDFAISFNEAQVVIEIYKKAFQELNLID